jgi:hypothetical protein
VDGVYIIRWVGAVVSGEVGVAGGEQRRRRRCWGRKGNEQERTRETGVGESRQMVTTL